MHNEFYFLKNDWICYICFIFLGGVKKNSNSVVFLIF